LPYKDRPRTRDERLGEAFRPDDRYEALVKMTPERREAVLQTSPLVRLGYGSYVVARSAAQNLQKEMPR